MNCLYNLLRPHQALLSITLFLDTQRLEFARLELLRSFTRRLPPSDLIKDSVSIRR